MKKEALGRFKQLPPWLGKQVAATVVGLGVAALVGWLITHHAAGAPPLPDQIDSLRSRLARAGVEVETFRQITLRPGITSVLLTTMRGRTDDVEIYDDIDGRLTRTFLFAPSVAAKPARGVIEPTEGVATPEPAPFSPEDVAGLDGDGPDRAVFGSINAEVVGAARRIPVVITWSIAHRKYVMSPLLLKPTVFARYSDQNRETSVVRELAFNTPRIPYVVADSHTHMAFTGYALTSYIIVQSEDGAVQYLLGAVVVDQSSAPVSDVLAINLWQVEHESDITAAGPCTEEAPQHLPAYYTAPIRVDVNHTPDLRAIWAEISSRLTSGSCLDVVIERREAQEEAERHPD
jgi:hypothetical protein